jgi:hypothetical protein
LRSASAAEVDDGTPTAELSQSELQEVFDPHHDLAFLRSALELCAGQCVQKVARRDYEITR